MTLNKILIPLIFVLTLGQYVVNPSDVRLALHMPSISWASTPPLQ